MLRRSFLILASAALLTASPCFAQSVSAKGSCGTVIGLRSISGGGVLIKPSNTHGGRGFTLLIQNRKYWYGPRKKEIYDKNCKKQIGSVVMYARDSPYGERYYSKLPGGSGDSGSSLARKARAAAGSSGGIIKIKSGVSFRVSDFSKREGSVHN